LTTRLGARSAATHDASASDAVLAAVAVCTLALNLRTAAVSLSPLVAWIEADIPLPPSVLGLLGMAPPIVFAFAGLALGRWIAPRGAGLAVLSLATVAVGSLMRAFATDIALIAGGGVIALLGMGIGNVLIPGLVRRYLPDRIGLVTALYTAMLAVSAVLPPFVEPSVAQTSSWRVAIGLWALLPIVGAVPMALLALRMRAREAARFGVAPEALARGPASAAASGAAPGPLRAPWRPGRTAVLLSLLFGASSVAAYSSFAWMPVIVREQFGVDETTAGLLLSLFAALGLPLALTVPRVIGRFGARAAGAVSAVCAGLAAAGYVMLAIGLPAAWAVLAVALIGLVQALFSMCLTLAGLLGRTPEETGRLSAFMQGVGYAAAAAFTLVLGYTRTWFGTWLPAGAMMAALSLAAVVAGILLSRSLARGDAPSS